MYVTPTLKMFFLFPLLSAVVLGQPDGEVLNNGHGGRYYYNGAGFAWFWVLFIIIGICLLFVACGGVYHWQTHQHVYRHGYRTVIDEQGNEKRLPYKEYEDTDYSEGDPAGGTYYPAYTGHPYHHQHHHHHHDADVDTAAAATSTTFVNFDI